MSMMQGRDTMMIELIELSRCDGGYELIAAYEKELSKLGGRPHWGQVNTLTASEGLLESHVPPLSGLAAGPQPAELERRVRQPVHRASRDLHAALHAMNAGVPRHRFPHEAGIPRSRSTVTDDSDRRADWLEVVEVLLVAGGSGGLHLRHRLGDHAGCG